ncbi:MAG: superoxide dismutase [Cu-Zn] SodC [Endomicrobia bacterium]|nr:superoxide dismutase [Cu-Zn] SodC [Endomicrobiia bacterium]
MKNFLVIVLGCIFVPAALNAETVKVNIYKVTIDGKSDKIGTVKISDSDKGLVVKAKISGLTPGEHGFHIHQNPSCGSHGADGSAGPALAAGGHYDPDNTGKHLGPYGDGHKGDLPFLTADKKGKVNETVTAPRLTVNDIKNRSIMIHQGGDNYSDIPEPLGGGGARIAIGIIQ